MTEPVPEPQIDHDAIGARSADLLNAVLLSVATIGDRFAVNLLSQQLLDAFTEGFYAGIDAAPLARPAGRDDSDKR
jgi:hypothetical protein